MTPMDPKDRPKVIALLLATVLLVGFVGKTAVSGFAKKIPPATTVAVTPAPPTVATGSPKSPGATAQSDRTLELGGPDEPFRKVLPDPSRLTGVPAPNRMDAPRAGHLTGTLGVGPLPVPGGSAVAIAGSPAGSGPVEPSVRLDGVVSTEDHSAMLTVGDKTDLYSVGQTVAGMYKLVAVSDRDATFRGPKGVFTLSVGEEKRSDVGAPKPQSEEAPLVTDAANR